jgi:hypothetical protein
MQWCHRVDGEWLAERKKYVTASDVQKLLPVTATGRARTNIEEAYLKVWAEKQCSVTEDDICSGGVMARGHLLEPYAVDYYNQLVGGRNLKHWDDVLVFRDGVSCSPDALDLAQPEGCPVALEEIEAKTMAEIKCYNAPGHYEKGMLTPKKKLDERWQIATAFYTMPSLEVGILILFNPNAAHPLFHHVYTPAELEDELKMVKTVSEEYRHKAMGFDDDAFLLCPPGMKSSCITEEEIIAELLEEQARDFSLNP